MSKGETGLSDMWANIVASFLEPPLADLRISLSSAATSRKFADSRHFREEVLMRVSIACWPFS
jgi:hypothetical protein